MNERTKIIVFAIGLFIAVVSGIFGLKALNDFQQFNKSLIEICQPLFPTQMSYAGETLDIICSGKQGVRIISFTKSLDEKEPESHQTQPQEKQ